MGPSPPKEAGKPASSTLTRLLAAGGGLSLFIAIVWWASPLQIFSKLWAFGWGMAALIALGGVTHLAKTLAWKYTFPKEHRTLSMLRLLGVRLAGEAVSQFTVAGPLVGETTRAWMVRSALPTASSVSAVIADRAMFTISSLLVAVAGLILWISAPGHSATPRSSGIILALILAGPILLWILALRNRWPLLSRSFQVLGSASSRVQSRLSTVSEVEDNLHRLYHDDRLNFLRILALNLAGQALSILEVYLILALLQINGSLVLALKIEAATKFINLFGSLVPGNLGTSEAGNMLLLSSLQMGAGNGVVLALARRLRGWAWAVVGMVILFFHAFVLNTVRADAGLTKQRRPAGPTGKNE